ncbi:MULTISPECIES: hypothetical protein [Streptomyces violaceoruber group]|uniref:Uncharacterized protein n=1 Tax=Streptomyces violaceoruber TaxID=1935 RepID=A0ACD4WDV5_STRVN|nr:hypothetical protein [Streptomyces anthocyanicus]WOY95922.1 hypothetical protein R2E43_00035 [Streptomyces violaceoruber]
MENTHLQGYFAAHGGAEQWGKYGTPRLNIPGGQGTFDIHFYGNEVSEGESLLSGCPGHAA